jgi:hypothetical protein
MVGVEEGASSNTHRRSAGRGYGLRVSDDAPYRRRVPVAARRRGLRGQVIAAVLEDDMQVAVVLGPNEHDRSDNRGDVPLKWKPRVGQCAGTGRVMRKWVSFPRWKELQPV